MAENEDAGERSEAATPRRREEARKKGQVARSRELVTLAIMLGSACGLMLLGDDIAQDIITLSRRIFRLQGMRMAVPEDMLQVLAQAIAAVSGHVLSLLGFIAVMAFAGSVAMGGLTFSLEQLQPKFERLSPMAGFKRMFGLQSVVELLKSVGKFSVVAIIAWLVMMHYRGEFLLLGRFDLDGSIAHAAELLMHAFLWISLSLIVIVLIDAPYQLWHFAHELRMSKQEVREEYKEMEGKPEVRGRIRRMQREIAQRRMMSQVPQADVVITNPEHYAVALKYDAMRPGAPMVLAKGVDMMALQIRRVAQAHGVYVMEAPPLARALYHTCEIDQEIPEGLYVAVAQVLAYVFSLKQKGRAGVRTPPKDFPIPEDMRY